METLGRYQILGELGRGGCGIVYRALDPGIGRTVAIKTILADAHSPAGVALRERFRREARSAGNLSHPNIVTIHEFNDSGEIMFIAMEFIQGRTLAERMAEGGPLPLDLVLAVVRSSAEALDYAHANGIVHRDVKPANFMLTAGGQVKVTDFGIAKMLDDDIGLTNTGMVIGTAQYMSPEQIAAKPASARSDQFSLAVIAYEMLTGQKPFQGNSWASVMHQIMSVEPPPVKQHRKDLGDDVTTVLRKALAKDPDTRYSSCREFADDLSRAVTGVTMQRTAPMPISTAMQQPFPPPRPDALPETQVMVSATIPVSAATPDTGQKILSPMGSTVAEPPAKRRSALLPVLMGASAVLILTLGWWRFSARPSVETPSEPAATIAATAPPIPADAPAAASPKSAPVSRPSPIKATPAAAAAPVASQPVQAVPVPVPSPAAAVPVTLPPPIPVATPAPAQATTPAAPAVTPPATTAVTTAAPTPAPAPPPAPKPAVVENVPAPSPAARNQENEEAARRAEEQRKAAAELSAARRSVDDALNRYRAAFESKDAEALKSIWPTLGRSELSSFQNFFKIARTIRLQLQPLGEAEINATGATIRARRTMAATDERGALPPQDQTVRIHLRRTGNGMVIDSIDTAAR